MTTDEHDKYLRLAADFDNYRKRMEQELVQAVRFGNERILLEVADVLDAIDRATGEYDMRILLTQILKKHDMTRIETAGKEFDPNTMEAVQMVPAVDGPSHAHAVQSEVQAGYTLHGKVIRPAKVIVTE